MKTPSSIFRLLRAAAAAGALALSAVRADADTNFAYRIDCEVQNPSGSLEPLVWEQGTTPLVEVRVLRQNRVVQVRDTTVRMIIGPSATGHYFAAVSNSVWSDINTCMIQWPSIGTNSMETGSWWYGITFHDPEGRIYWTGSGSLDIQPTLSNGEDGLIWQYFADSTERVTYITTNHFYTTNFFILTNLEEVVTSVNGQTGDVEIPTNFIPVEITEEDGRASYAATDPVTFRDTATFESNVTARGNVKADSMSLDDVEIKKWSDIATGSGFPLTNNANFNSHGADRVRYLALDVSENPGDANTITYDGEKLLLGTNAVGSGSLAAVWGPKHMTNQAEYVTNNNARTMGIRPAESNANIRIEYDPETSTYSLQAIGGIPGPQGADGVGNVHWAGEWYAGMFITNENTWVSYDGSIWTRAPSEDPILAPPTNNATWTKVVSRGHDGQNGSDGHDGVGLQFVDWSTDLTVINTNMLLSYGGYLLMITNDVPIKNPGFPVIEDLPVPPYRAIVRPGADGGSAVVYSNASFIIDFDLQTPVGSNSLVVYHDFLWYARQNYVPNETPPPTSGSYWTCLGMHGERGPAGANGIGNLRYMGAWDQYRTNEVNDIVRWTRADGKVDWYRATGTSHGARPDVNTNYWSKEITSGTDANTIEWKFVDGSYDVTVSHSNELYRGTDGRVWYSVGVVPAGASYQPGVNASFWHLFVRDGTSVASNTVWRGAWRQGENYGPGDMVTHQFGNGAKSLFICTNATENYVGTIAPPDVRCWAEIASGIQGETGAKGADGTATHIVHTNVVTYEHVYETNITHVVTNDQTTAIHDYDVPSTIYNSVKFNNSHFDFDLSQSTFSLTAAALGVGTFNGWTGAVQLKPGSNITFDEDGTNKKITINATVPEIDLSSYAQKGWVSVLLEDYAPNTSLESVSVRVSAIENDYITSDELDDALEDYAPKSEITVIATNIEEIVSALSNPVIQTPDHKKWTMQGRYSGGKVTHVWVPYVGAYASPIRIAMPDGKIYEMAGRYMDGNTNIITHVWEEVSE